MYTSGYSWRWLFIFLVSFLALVGGLSTFWGKWFQLSWSEIHLRTAIGAGFLLSGAALFSVCLEKRVQWLRWLGVPCAIALFILGSVVLYDYFIDWEISHLDVRPLMYPYGLIFTEAVNFLLLGITLLILMLNKRPGGLRLVLSFVIFTISILALFGRTYRIKPDLTIEYYTQMPIAVILFFLMISIACALVRSDYGIMKVIISNTTSGKYTRRILIALVVIPLMVSYLENLGEVYKLYDPDFGDSILSTTTLILMILLALLNAKYLSTEEAQKIQTQKELDYITDYDEITGLLNQQGFMNSLEQILHDGKDSSIAVIKFSLNQFELVTNVAGIEVGNILLKHLTQRFTHEPALSGVPMARVGSSEFGFIFRNIQDVRHVADAVNKLLVLTSKVITVKERNIFMTASAGISIYPDDASTTEKLLMCADQALHLAKQQAGNSFQFFTANLSLVLSDQVELENELHFALSDNQFQLYYQPQVDVSTGELCSAEALIRWVHPKKGIISPTVFIPVAEATGLIVVLGEWILREVCQQIKRGLLHTTKNNKPISIAVNVSPAQFNPDYPLVTNFERIIKEYEVDPALVELEITESALMQDMELNLKRFAEFKKIGFSLSIDDFGTGFSSFSYINHIPNDKVKIDKSFIDGLPNDKNDAVLVTAMIHMFHQLNKKIVAEGVETKEQYEFLKMLNCDVVQGYYYSKPLSLDEFKKFVSQR